MEASVEGSLTVTLTVEEFGLLGELLYEMSENRAEIAGGRYEADTRYTLKKKGHVIAHGLLAKVASPGGQWGKFFKRVKK